ncbi:MAG TPA: acetyl/propionyl/methylcrotonyl-CoA carboxylase subunit alpha [Gammaproteobacteria bacterium]|nr:acetyl/propionyl/methylcrotonyl-CoA carboxylase subunit alpha [Gammaproteobacteria bacterium]
MMFSKILIANRGEIACRVIETCRRFGIRTVAVYSDADADARHVHLADEAFHIGPARAADSYLNTVRILEAAKTAGAEAIHPGYGFLSENAPFARAVADAGLVFIGPRPDTIEVMGSKSRAKALMEDADVPVVPGYHGDNQDAVFLKEQAEKIGWPLMIKAVAGGGGKGMRIVRTAAEFADALEGAKREAKGAFGDDQVLLEKYVEQPRHIEMQIFGDNHGNAVHLFERECTLQRRYQKVVEETPSPFLDDATREKMAAAAVNAARAVGYVNAGTIEFIVGADRSFYFMEMNTRLQVEHPVTEMTTGLDLVEWQLRVAAGEPLPLEQAAIKQRGHAVEVRLYAENVGRGFLPATGHIERFIHPVPDTHFRVDTGVGDGDEISIHYDPMIAKLSVRDHDRMMAIKRLQEALSRTAVFGLVTNLDLLQGIAAHPDFAAGAFDTGFIESELEALLHTPSPSPVALAAASAWVLHRLAVRDAAADPHSPWAQHDGWQLNGGPGMKLVFSGAENMTVRVSGTSSGFGLQVGDQHYAAAAKREDDGTWSITLDDRVERAWLLGHHRTVHISIGDERHAWAWVDPLAAGAAAANEDTRPISPMPGRVVAVNVTEGDAVEPGQALLVLEGMKMEYTLKAATAGTIAKLLCAEGDMVEAEAPLVEIAAATSDNEA